MPRLSKIGAASLAAFGFSSGGAAGVTASYLVVAGGGGGGAGVSGVSDGGGGGAGGYQANTTTLVLTTSYTVTVGAGGASSANGSNSVFGTLTASVGGGAGAIGANGSAGGSGGGASGNGLTTATGGSPTSGQGFAGGNNTGSFYGAAGGGGASAVGQNAGTIAGNGGAGSASSISGSSVTYAGGGGGGGGTGNSSGGTGGGGNGSNSGGGAAGTANLGAGGGGSVVSAAGGAGGSGIVIVSYTGAQQFGGGVITTSGGNTIHTFTTSGTLVPITSLSASYLIVAGGGGGGGTSGGGGGAGGLLSGSALTIDTSSTYLVTVGAGGNGSTSTGSNGSSSSFGLVSTTAVGGGGGGPNNPNTNGIAGGSGGGAGGSGTAGVGGAATASQGYAGGANWNTSVFYGGGGGGGAGAVGSAGAAIGGGSGGAGTASSITGSSVTYAAGGGGGSQGGVASSGGSSIGGAGTGGDTTGGTGTVNTGSGGGGAGYVSGSASGGAGGSGIVIISYAGATQSMAGGSVTITGGNVIHTFTSSGYLTPLTLLNNSLRFRSSASAYLNKTYGTSPTSRTTMTISAWVKRGVLSSGTKTIFGTGNNYESAYFNSSDQLYIGGPYMSAQQGSLTTSQVFRDPAAWYHIVIVFDTTNATAANRIRLFVNGTQVTAFSSSTNSNQNNTTTEWLVSGAQSSIGATSGTNFFDGYIANVQVIDGQALTPNSFGTFNSYGVWQPINYGGSYGTNGFYLPFTNATSTTTLGYDFSPQGNNWTTNNISVTAGVTYDSMTDVPTLTSATAANYCVLNAVMPGDYFASGQAAMALTNGNLNYGATGRNAFGSMAVSSGKWYYEFSNTANTGAAVALSGLVTVASRASVYGVYYNSSNGNKGLGTLNTGATETAYGATWTDNDIIGVALDMDAATPTVTFYKNNSSQGAISVSSFVGQTVFAWMQNGANSNNMSGYFNFGQRPFTYSAPSGYVALNTYNL